MDALIDVLVAGWKAEAARPEGAGAELESDMEMEAG